MENEKNLEFLRQEKQELLEKMKELEKIETWLEEQWRFFVICFIREYDELYCVSDDIDLPSIHERLSEETPGQHITIEIDEEQTEFLRILVDENVTFQGKFFYEDRGSIFTFDFNSYHNCRFREHHSSPFTEYGSPLTSKEFVPLTKEQKEILEEYDIFFLPPESPLPPK